MFGIQAIRIQKRIDVQVELKPWQDGFDYDRIGLENNYVEIHEIKIPMLFLPVSPGKNMSIIIEVVAMNHILKTYGYNASKEFTERLTKKLHKKSQSNNVLINDKE